MTTLRLRLALGGRQASVMGIITVSILVKAPTGRG